MNNNQHKYWLNQDPTDEQLNIILYGKDSTRYITSCEVIDEHNYQIWRRDIETNEVHTEYRKWNSWVYTSDVKFATHLFRNRKDKFVVRKRYGDLPYQYIINTIEGESKTYDIGLEYSHFKNDGNSNYVNMNNLWGNDSFFMLNRDSQCRVQQGFTEFKNMIWDDTLRCTIDIETMSLDPTKGYCFMVVCGLNRIIEYNGENKQYFIHLYLEEDIYDPLVYDKEKVLSDLKIFLLNTYGDLSLLKNTEIFINRSEVGLLNSVQENIYEIDPDILELHNHYFDIPFLVKRSDINNIGFSLSREDHNGSRKNTYIGEDRKSLKLGADTTRKDLIRIYGRQIVDTMESAMRRNAITRDMKSYGLKYLAKKFDLSDKDRVYIDGDDIRKEWESGNLAKVIVYCINDVQETQRLSNMLNLAPFSMSQMVPMSFEKLCYCGNSQIWTNLITREYYRLLHSLPKPEQQRQFEGGYVDYMYEGILENIYKLDFGSLYPSIMINRKLFSDNDPLRLIWIIEKNILDMRLQIKKEAKTHAKHTSEYQTLQSKQEALKILINSAFGILGNAHFNFNDYKVAETITETGRISAKYVIEELENLGMISVEADTDGIIVSTRDSMTYDEEVKIIDYLNIYLDNKTGWGLKLDHDGRNEKMFSYSMKNYALWDYEKDMFDNILPDKKRLKIKGAALLVADKQPYAKDFIENALILIFKEDYDGLKKLYLDIKHKIQYRLFPTEMMCDNKKMNKTMEEYHSPENKSHTLVYMELANEYNKKHPGYYKHFDKIKFYNNATHEDPNKASKSPQTEKIMVDLDTYHDCPLCNGSAKIWADRKKTIPLSKKIIEEYYDRNIGNIIDKNIFYEEFIKNKLEHYLSKSITSYKILDKCDFLIWSKHIDKIKNIDILHEIIRNVNFEIIEKNDKYSCTVFYQELINCKNKRCNNGREPDQEQILKLNCCLLEECPEHDYTVDQIKEEYKEELENLCIFIDKDNVDDLTENEIFSVIRDYNIDKYLKMFHDKYVVIFKKCFTEEHFNNIFSDDLPLEDIRSIYTKIKE